MSDANRKTWRGAPGEAQTSGPRFAARSHLLASIFRRERPRRALDVGCGRGAITRQLARHAGRVLATEVSDEAVQAASEALSDCSNVEVRRANIFDGGGDDLTAESPFDLILLSEVLEHLNDDEGALGTVNRLLAPDGLLVITIPRDPSFWSVEDELWDHKRRYTREDLVAKLDRAGFEVETFWTWGFPVTKQLVRYQISRLRPTGEEVRSGPPSSTRPPSAILPLLRLAFAFIVRLESLFKHRDSGIGYVLGAKKSPDRG